MAWTDLPSLEPGATATLTVTARSTDLSLRPYVHVAEITEAGIGDTVRFETKLTNAANPPPAPPSTPGELPATGGNSEGPIRLASLLLGAGLVVALLVRRRRANAV